MKIKLQKNSRAKEFIVDIPQSVNVNNLSIGEKFTVIVDNQVSVEACFLADGRSLLVGSEIIRLDKRIDAQKKELFKLAFTLDKFKTKNHFYANVIRPVEPKQIATNQVYGNLFSPMTGKVIQILVKEDDVVREGDILLIIEAMKMENRIFAECEGVIKNIKVTNGINITAGDTLLSINSMES